MLTGPKIGSVSGISTHLENITNSKLAQKYKFLVANSGKFDANENTFRKVKRLIFDYRYFLSLLKNVDLVHINTAFTKKAIYRDIVLSFLCKAKNIKHVIQFHSGKPVEEVMKSVVLRNMLRLMKKNSDANIFLLKSELEAQGKQISISNNYKIYNGIDEYPYKKIKKNFLRNGILKLGYIGRLDFEKGILESIEVVKILKYEKKFPVFYMIAGHGDAEKSIRKKAIESGIEKNVIFLGVVQNGQKIEFWEQIDIFLFPTRFAEGIPYSLLESMFSGTPVITTRSGGLNEFIDRIQGVIVVEQGNTQEIVNEIVNLMQDPAQLIKRSNALKESAKKYFSLEKMADQLDKCYQKVMFG